MGIKADDPMCRSLPIPSLDKRVCDKALSLFAFPETAGVSAFCRAADKLRFLGVSPVAGAVCSDMVNTLLHEMIHAYLFVAEFNSDHDDHGPTFLAHARRINCCAGSNVTGAMRVEPAERVRSQIPSSGASSAHCLQFITHFMMKWRFTKSIGGAAMALVSRSRHSMAW